MHGEREGRSRRWRACLAVATVAALSACSSSEPESDAATELLFSADPTPTSATTPAPTAEPSPSEADGLPRSCGAVITTLDVARITGVNLRGETTFLFADELPDIGRTGRVTCGYGDIGDGPSVEVTLNEYVSDEAATERVDITLQAAAERGDRVREQQIGQYDGYVLADRDDVSLVVDAGSRTMVVTLERGLVPRRAEVVVLEQLGTAVLGEPTATLDETNAP